MGGLLPARPAALRPPRGKRHKSKATVLDFNQDVDNFGIRPGQHRHHDTVDS
jgi:hypothetical protein